MAPLLAFTNHGIFCEQANVYIDPWKPVKRAIITHGHSDHARYGHQQYLTHRLTAPVIHYRLGADCKIETVEYGETFSINGVRFTLFPAGHIPGSAQVRVEYKGEVWVATGDYKLKRDELSEAFEPISCNTLITECTFGLPVFKWPSDEELKTEINAWWRANKEQGLTTVIGGYALGKAQRIISMLDEVNGRIFTHGAVENMNEVLRNAGVSVQNTIRVTPELKKSDFMGNIVVATPSAISGPWMNRFKPYSTGIASGWMALRGARRRRSVDRGFVLSDHSDWNDLNEAIKLSGAERVICTHGYTGIFSEWLKSQGLDATVESTEFEGELAEIGEGSEKETE